MELIHATFKSELIAKSAIRDCAIAFKKVKSYRDVGYLVDEVVNYLKSSTHETNLTRLSDKALDNLSHMDEVKLFDLARTVIYNMEED